MMPRLILDSAKIGKNLTCQGGCVNFPWIFLHKKNAAPLARAAVCDSKEPESGLRGFYFTRVVAASSRPMERMPSWIRITCSSDMYWPRRYWRISEALMCMCSASLLTLR